METQKLNIRGTDFYKLSYTERLVFWDSNELSFKNESCFDKYGKHFSLTPENRDEQIFFGKWLLDHWREYYISGSYKHDLPSDEDDDEFEYKPFEIYFQNYLIKTTGNPQKSLIIALELQKINNAIFFVSRNIRFSEYIQAKLFDGFSS